MKRYTKNTSKKIRLLLTKNAIFINSLSVVALIALFALTFYTDTYIDLVFILGFFILTAMTIALSIRSSQIVAVALICIIAAAGMLVIGYSQYAQVFAQWAYLFLLFAMGYNLIYYFLHKKELAK